MIITIQIDHRSYAVDFSTSYDLSIPVKHGEDNVSAWYLDRPSISPVVMDDFVGQVSQGGSTNFNSIWFNPHAHMTHTECLGHITKEFYSVNKQLKEYHFPAFLITVEPTKKGEDLQIGLSQLKARLEKRTLIKEVDALVIRTLPNTAVKQSKKYDHTNPPYFTEEAMDYIVSLGIDHLLVDLPSVDKEKDGGALRAHHSFWKTKTDKPRKNATITEFIYVDDEISDGFYLLDLQVAPFENDASPSRPVLYPLEKA